LCCHFSRSRDKQDMGQCYSVLHLPVDTLLVPVLPQPDLSLFEIPGYCSSEGLETYFLLFSNIQYLRSLLSPQTSLPLVFKSCPILR
jgi:hypothetical protein